MQNNWTADDVKAAISTDGTNPEQSAMLTDLIQQIAITPVGDWAECPLCLDMPVNPVMTVCRHVFCEDCIYAVFDIPTARGVANGEEDEDNDIEELGEHVACPICRHKLSKTDIAKFIPPSAKKTSP